MEYIKFDILEKYGYLGIQTTKNAGDMKNNDNLNKILLSIGANKRVAKANQTHSTNILCIDKYTDLDNLENIDGFITKEDVTLVTFYADCLPIFLLDKKNDVYGLIHSGWRGTVNGILKEAISIFKSKYHSNIEDIIICFGVGISCENYEIKEDMVKTIITLLDFDNMVKYNDGKMFFDNTLLNKRIALSLGIKEENIYMNNYCTYNDNFYSYRRDKTANRSSAIFIKKEIDNGNI